MVLAAEQARRIEERLGEAPHEVACMEIWGGNEPADDAISVPGVDAWVYSAPYQGEGVGGDIHYVSTCGSGNISRFVVADVAGHGEAVGAIAEKLRKLMRRHINTLDQTRFARSLNEEFAALSDTGAFATAISATYFAPTDHLVTCNAGHPPPLWRSAADVRWSALTHDSDRLDESVRNLPLGVIEPTEYRQFAAPLAPGDLVLLYSDSLIESTDRAGEQLGEAGLLEIVRALDATSPQSFLADLIGRLRDRAGGEPFEDDVTAMLLEHNGHDPGRHSLRDWGRVLAKLVGLSPV